LSLFVILAVTFILNFLNHDCFNEYTDSTGHNPHIEQDSCDFPF